MPPSLPVRRVFDFNPNSHGWKRPRGRPKTRWADSIKHYLHSAGLDTINTTPGSMTDPRGRPFFADCQRSNPSMALKSSKSSTKLNLIGSLGHHQNMFFQSFSHDNNNNNIKHDNQHFAYFGIQNDKLNF